MVVAEILVEGAPEVVAALLVDAVVKAVAVKAVVVAEGDILAAKHDTAEPV